MAFVSDTFLQHFTHDATENGDDDRDCIHREIGTRVVKEPGSTRMVLSSIGGDYRMCEGNIQGVLEASALFYSLIVAVAVHEYRLASLS
jgi:hypothetical protein